MHHYAYNSLSNNDGRCVFICGLWFNDADANVNTCLFLTWLVAVVVERERRSKWRLTALPLAAFLFLMSTSKPADQLAAMAGSTNLTDKMEAEVQRLLDVSTRSGVHRRMSSYVFLEESRLDWPVGQILTSYCTLTTPTMVCMNHGRTTSWLTLYHFLPFI